MRLTAQRIILLLSPLLLASGCVSYQTVTVDRLEDLVDGSNPPVEGHAVWGWYYMGTDDGFHHFKKRYVYKIVGPPPDLYRVDQSKLMLSIPIHQGVVTPSAHVSRIFGAHKQFEAYDDWVIDQKFVFEHR